jgi:two-component system, OmpR family, sensor kinase
VRGLIARTPLRVRLALAFAVALAVLLAVAGTIAYLDVKGGLDGSLDANLRTRAHALQGRSGGSLERALRVQAEPAQLLAADGRVLASSPGDEVRSLLTRAELARAAHGEVGLERHERARILAEPVGAGRVLVVATSMVPRERALEALGGGLLLGLPLILVVASGAGYLVAAGALAPVERMRRRAADISAATPDARLPLPASRDELHRLGETLNAMLMRLEGAAAHERAFLATASHELRTPLAILKAEVDLALDQPASEDDLRAALASVREEADRLNRLAEDLLVIARGGDLPLRRVAVDLGALAGELASAYALTAGPDAVRSTVPAGLTVVADRLRIEQALGNLVDNALRHGVPPVTISAGSDRETVQLRVTDEGSGFGRTSDRAAAASSGLGLQIVAGIAAAHGGSVETATLEGHGQVTLALPLSPPA